MRLRLPLLVLAPLLVAACSFDGGYDARSPDGQAASDATNGNTAVETTPSRVDALAAEERDPRPRLPPRSAGLLATEERSLRDLLSSTEESSPEKPQLLRRLAEVESEMARMLEKTQHDAAQKAHASAGDTYGELAALKDEKSNEALYYAAYESELAGDYEKAKRRYLDLVQRAPESPFVPYAYVAFGEIALRATGDGHEALELTAKSYKEATLATHSKIRPLALFRLADVLEKEGDAEGAAKTRKILTHDFPESPEVALLGKAEATDSSSGKTDGAPTEKPTKSDKTEKGGGDSEEASPWM